MMDNDDNGQMTKLMLAHLQDQGMQQLESYLKRGRVLENKSTEELKERWIVLFREMAELDNTQETERHDIEAELSSRKDGPPYNLVEDEFKAFIKIVGAGVEEILQDPDRKEDVENSVMADFISFLDGLDKPPN